VTHTFSSKVLIATTIVIAGCALALMLWFVRDIVLLSFAGFLLAVALQGITKGLQWLTRLPYAISLFIVVLLLLALAVLATWLIVPALIAQLEELFVQLIAALEALENQVRESNWGQELLEQFEEENGEYSLPIPPWGDMFGQVTATFALTFTAVANVLVVLFIALFVASNPARYREGVVRLVPIARREKAREVIRTIVVTLRKWLLGTLISMCVVGLVSGLGLALLGVPLALLLGVISGLFEFIPLVGPIVGTIPAVLVAFVSSPLLALYVLIFYVVLQQLEGNVLTPLVQQHAVSLPPAVTLIAVLLFGLLFGPLGYLLATPLAAVIMALVKMLYVRDTLGDNVNLESGMNLGNKQ
jgi:predicted PurR-regulated permease PerM